MGFSVADYDPNQKGGLPLPGKAQFLVVGVEEKDSYYSVNLLILAHEHESEVGKTSYNNFNKAGKGARRCQLFFEATKVISLEEINEALERGETDIEFDCEDAESTVFFGTLEAGSYTKDGKEKKTCKVEFDFLAFDDPDAKGYPYSAEYVPPWAKEEKKGSKKKSTTKKETKPENENKDETPFSDDDLPF